MLTNAMIDRAKEEAHKKAREAVDEYMAQFPELKYVHSIGGIRPLFANPKKQTGMEYLPFMSKIKEVYYAAHDAYLVPKLRELVREHC